MAHNELEGEVIAETGYSKFLDMIQEKKLTKAEKEKKEQIVKRLKSKYGKTSKTYAIATSVAKRVAEEEEKKSEEPGCEDDSRAKYAEREVIKNRLRAGLGIKNPIVMTAGYDPEGDVIDEAEQRIRQPRQSANPRGTYDPTGIGLNPRTPEEKAKMRKRKPVAKYPELKPRNNSGYDNNYDREHPALTASQRNRTLG